MLVHQLLERSARDTPEAPALLTTKGLATYDQLTRLSGRYAHACLRHGVQPRDRVVLALENSIDFVAAYFGVMRAGAVAVPLPAGPRNDRLAAAIVDCAPSLGITDRATLRAVAPDSDAANVRWLVSTSANGRVESGGGYTPSETVEAALAAAPATPPPTIDIADDSLAAVVYTSGSTGSARGVMLTHRNIVANTRSIVACLGLTASDRVMCVLPLYYVYGLSLLHTHVMVGGSVVLDNRFAYPNVVLQAMRERHVTGFAGVPSTFAILLHRSDLKTMTFPDLRYVTQAGGAMPPSHICAWLAEGPPVPFHVMYGATEASARITCLPPGDLPRKIGSIGRPIHGVGVDVVTEDGRPARPGEVGELVARGENISPGYWGHPDETRRAFGQGGYRTGDLGYADEEGYLFLVGRRQDILKVGAHRIGVREIEDVLCQHPAIHQAAVVGAPHELLGEVPVAFVTMRDGPAGVGEQAIRAYCAAKLPPHKVPVKIEFLRELPSHAAGKIDKVTLKACARSMAHAGEGHASDDDGYGHHRDDGPELHRQ